MNDFSQPQCAKPALNVAQDGVGGCFLADRGSKRRCRSLAILAALLSFGGCLRGDAVIDFRNFIEGVLDAPVYDVDGVTKLEGNRFFVALFADWTIPFLERGPTSMSSVGFVSPFQTGTNAGYWVPQNWTIPGATPGQRIWVLVMVFSTQPCFEACPNIFWGSSKPFPIVLQATPTPLTGLESFNLGPQWFGVRRQGGDLVMSWLNQGNATYSLEATTDLGAAGSWKEFWRGSGYYPAGNFMSVTNAIIDEQQFFRLRMWR